jgi:septal ring factor EnvC (AmiA/AmiB activator)
VIRRRSSWTWTASLLVLTAVATSGANAGDSQAGAAALDASALERRLATLEREERSLEAELKVVDAELARLRTRLVARGRAYYRVARGGPRTEDWFEHAIRVERLRRGVLVDAERLKELTVRSRTQRERLALVRERRAPLAAESQNFEQMRAALLSQREREDAFQRAFSESRGAPHTAIYAAGLGASVSEGAGFAELRGRLPFPLPGRTEIEQVRRKWAHGAGLSMHAPPGTSVRAVFPGRVAFADEYGDYGKTVILDHGDGYYTVSALLGAIDVTTGDEVAAGSRVGTLGVGAAGRAELYFEVRRGNDTLAPSEWFGI